MFNQGHGSVFLYSPVWVNMHTCHGWLPQQLVSTTYCVIGDHFVKHWNFIPTGLIPCVNEKPCPLWHPQRGVFHWCAVPPCPLCMHSQLHMLACSFLIWRAQTFPWMVVKSPIEGCAKLVDFTLYAPLRNGLPFNATTSDWNNKLGLSWAKLSIA